MNKLIKDIILSVIATVLVAAIFCGINYIFNVDFNKMVDISSILIKDKDALSEKDIKILSDLNKPECTDKNEYLNQVRNILKNQTFKENDIIQIISNLKNSLRYDELSGKYINTNRKVMIGFYDFEEDQYIGEIKKMENGTYTRNGYGIYVDYVDYDNVHIYLGEWSEDKKNGIIVELDDYHDINKGIYIGDTKIKDLTGFYIPHEARFFVFCLIFAFILSVIAVIIRSIRSIGRHRKAIS